MKTILLMTGVALAIATPVEAARPSFIAICNNQNDAIRMWDYWKDAVNRNTGAPIEDVVEFTIENPNCHRIPNNGEFVVKDRGINSGGPTEWAIALGHRGVGHIDGWVHEDYYWNSVWRPE